MKRTKNNTTHDAPPAHPRVSRSTRLMFAGKADIDPRTARRILEVGLSAVRNESIRERASRAAADLGIVLPSAAA